MTDFKDVDDALADLQGVLPVIKKATTGNVGGRATKYADLADICKEILPLTSERGLAWLTRPTMVIREDGAREFVLQYSLRHAPSGTSHDGEYPLGTGNPQQLGSAITYARRYTFCAVTGAVADVDDDGTAASQQPKAGRDRQPPRPFDQLPRNQDGSLSRSRCTDEELRLYGNMDDKAQRAHNKLERDVLGTDSNGKVREPQGERLDETPPDDLWLDQPPPAVRTPRPAGNVAGVIHREFTRLGFEEPRDRQQRLGVMSAITGRTITTTNDLDAGEALEVKRLIQSCRDQGVLAQKLLERQQEAPDAG